MEEIKLEDIFEKDWPKPDYSNKKKFPHGKPIERKMMPYGDLIIYEDGYEEYYSIGD